MNKKQIEAVANKILSNEEFFLTTPTRDYIRGLDKKELVVLHTTLGRQIRNTFQLHANAWTPKIVDGVDVSPNHPDAVSMKIIEVVWKKLQN